MYMYYVYAYLRTDGTPYYIGKGKGRRAFQKHGRLGLPPKDRIVFLEQNLSNVGACALERRYIRWYGKLSDGTGILRNVSDGGDGNTGPRSEEWCSNHSEKMKGKRHSDETRKKLSQADRSYMRSESYSQKMSEVFRNRQSVRTVYCCSVCGLVAKASRFREGFHLKCKRTPGWTLTKKTLLLSPQDRQSIET